MKHGDMMVMIGTEIQKVYEVSSWRSGVEVYYC